MGCPVANCGRSGPRSLGSVPPATLGRDVLALAIAYARQERRQGGLSKLVARELDRLFDQTLRRDRTGNAAALMVLLPRSGTILVREWQGTSHHVTVVDGLSVERQNLS
jgi:hypothetical protein